MPDLTQTQTTPEARMAELGTEDGSGEYIFDTGSDLGKQHVALLEHLLDEPTTRILQGAGVREGGRCLEIGAGGGSVARWLAERVGSTGRVVAIDLETDHLAAGPGVDVRRWDIHDGIPDGGPYDLIHARLVLAHLPRRRELVQDLIRALAPGGWLVLGEVTDRPMTVLSAPTESDAALFTYMQHLSLEVVSPARGLSFEWAGEVPGQMAAAGLLDLHGLQHSETSRGGAPGSLLHRNLNMQAEPLLREAGATTTQLTRYRELLLDPSFTAWFYEFACFRGRRPV